MYTSFVNIPRCEAEFHNPLKSFAYYHKPTFGGGQSFNVFAPEDRLIPTVLLQFRSICGAPLGVRLLRWPPNCHADDNNHYSDCRQLCPPITTTSTPGARDENKALLWLLFKSHKPGNWLKPSVYGYFWGYSSQQDSCRGPLRMFIAVYVLSACLSLCMRLCLASFERGSHPVTREDTGHRWSCGKLYKYIPTHPHLKCSTVTLARTRLTTTEAAIWLTMCGKAVLELRRKVEEKAWWIYKLWYSGRKLI